MAGGVRIPRSRGGLSGLILVVLGAWGGIAPYIGPSFGFGFTPDKAWASTQGRLYLSAVPGVVVLLAGLMVLVTRSRWFGGLCAMMAALGGAWFTAGAYVIRLLPASLGAASISTGAPIGTTASRVALTELGVYVGIGALIVFFAALALGRFSLAAHKDHARAAELAGVAGLAGAGALAFDAYGSGPGQGAQTYPEVQSQYPSQYPSGQDSFPDQYPTTQDQYPTSQDPYATTQSSFPGDQVPPAQV